MFSSLRGNSRSDEQHSAQTKHAALLSEWRTERLVLLLPFYLWINKRRSFSFSPLLRSMRVLFAHQDVCTCSALSVSGKWTWKYTELAVIICEGLFKFEGNVEGEKKGQTEIQMRVLYACWAEWVKPLWVCVRVRVCVSVFHIVAWWCCLGQSAGVNGLNLLAHDSQIVLITK